MAEDKGRCGEDRHACVRVCCQICVFYLTLRALDSIGKARESQIRSAASPGSICWFASHGWMDGCVFVLEDDMTIDLEVKLAELRQFSENIQIRGWNSRKGCKQSKLT